MELVNRVAQSGLVTLDLEQFYPAGEVVAFDLRPYLFMEMILKEKDFREVLKQHDWSQYQGKNLAVFCSADAIIPMWAYMLVSVYATPFANEVVQCTPEQLPEIVILKKIAALDITPYSGQRMVIKGCGDQPVLPSAYLTIAQRLQPVAKSIMYGEPCSTVPVYKQQVVESTPAP